MQTLSRCRTKSHSLSSYQLAHITANFLFKVTDHLSTVSRYFSGMGLNDLPLRTSNEGLLRPRVARARRSFGSLPASGREHETMVVLRSPSPSTYFLSSVASLILD